MKTRLVSLSFRGSASVDPRYSAAMLPWTINDIRSTESYTKLSVGIENGVLESYNSDFELQFSHPLKHIVGMCRIVNRQNGKSVGNGFLQIKQPATTTLTTSNGIKHHVSALTSSASHGSLSSNAAASAATASQSQADGAGSTGGAINGQAAQTAANQQSSNNFMEFTGPITGVVYLMKDPKDPLLHIYLFECESVDEVRFF